MKNKSLGYYKTHTHSCLLIGLIARNKCFGNNNYSEQNNNNKSIGNKKNKHNNQ